MKYFFSSLPISDLVLKKRHVELLQIKYNGHSSAHYIFFQNFDEYLLWLKLEYSSVICNLVDSIYS